jgi:ribonuclease HI
MRACIKVREMINPTIGLSLSRTKLRLKKTPELRGEIFCWFDGAAQQNGLLCGVGGVIKTPEMTTYRWTLNCGQGSNTRAELLGVWACLTLALRLNLDVTHVLGDSKIVIDWINQSNKLQVTSLLGWKTKIRELIAHFMDIKFTHIYREENMEADALSKLALQVPEGRIFYNKWQDGHEGPPLTLQLYP